MEGRVNAAELWNALAVGCCHLLYLCTKALPCVPLASCAWSPRGGTPATSGQPGESRTGWKATTSSIQRSASWLSLCAAPASPGGVFCQLCITSRCSGSLPRILSAHWPQKGWCPSYTSAVPSPDRRGIVNGAAGRSPVNLHRNIWVQTYFHKFSARILVRTSITSDFLLAGDTSSHPSVLWFNWIAHLQDWTLNKCYCFQIEILFSCSASSYRYWKFNYLLRNGFCFIIIV